MSLELILVDNASRDNSVSLCREEFEGRIKLVLSQKNRGLAAAYNLGAQEASGDYLFFLNSDTEIKEDVISPLVSTLENNSSLAVLAPQILTPEKEIQDYSHGDFPRLSRLFFGRFIAPVSVQAKNGPLVGRQIQFVDWICGVAVMMRKAIWAELRGWDEGFFRYFEDVDFCWRARQSGYDVGVLRGAGLVHFGGRRLPVSRSRQRQYYRSQERFFRQNYGPAQARLLRIIRWPRRVWISLEKD